MHINLGRKIKKYRIRSGISQLQLELLIDTSPGRISKIENGVINPDKETIIKIAYALKLTNNEIASLFGIELPSLHPVFHIINEILVSSEVDRIIELTVNDLIFKLGFIASALFVVHDNRVYLQGLTISSLSQKAVEQLEKPLTESYMNLKTDHENLTIKAINENKEQYTEYTREYCSPLVSTRVADNIQDVTGDKSVMIYPLVVNQRKIGAIAYVKKVIDDFQAERELLKVISNQIAVALYNVDQ